VTAPFIRTAMPEQLNPRAEPRALNKPTRIARPPAAPSAIPWMLLTIAAWAGGSQAVADSAVLNPVADTFISQEYTNSNFGAMGFVNVGTTENMTAHRGMVLFDIAGAIPAGSAITSAQLILEATRLPSNGYNNSDVGLHRMLRGWGEGDNAAGLPRDAAAADLNEANWYYRFAGTSSTWGVPGGQEGVDYLAQSSAVTRVTDIDGYGFGSTPEMIADVQFWLNNPGQNHGWMAISMQEHLPFTARRFGSREAVPSFDMPRLLVDFVPVPEPSTGILIAWGTLSILALRHRSTTRFRAPQQACPLRVRRSCGHPSPGPCPGSGSRAG